jgi:class 3 adenylate cyclase
MDANVAKSTVNVKLLDEKLAELEKARPWSPRVMSKLESLVNADDDFQLFRVNPLKFAKTRSMDEQEAIDLFLHAAKLGLFRLEWQLLCPSCGDTVESFGTLNNVHSHYQCQLCAIEGDAQLDNYIEVSFTISPQVRDIKYHHPETLSLEDLYFKYHFKEDARVPGGGPIFLDAAKSLIKAAGFVAPGETQVFEAEAQDGILSGYDAFTKTSVHVTLQSHSGPDAVHVVLQEGAEPITTKAGPGKVVFSVKNGSGKKASFVVLNKPASLPHYESLVFEPFLSGNRLLTSQTFRTLFRSETLGSTGGIGVKELTLLFTDLKGSTEMYERIGDLKAFALVQQHFDYLGKAIDAEHGAIVKTIGDAVMASFEKPADALRAALAMLREIESFNRAQGSDEIILKIGMHRGASIAVTLNERLDYFGQTVNIAARVQGLAGAEEIYLTDDIYRDREVQELLKQVHVEPKAAQLKGIQKALQVYKISFRGVAVPEAPQREEVPSWQAPETGSAGRELVGAASGSRGGLFNRFRDWLNEPLW